MIVVRALLAGALVVLFSLLGEMLRPKSFAGIFAAAPSIALASLVVVGLTKGTGALTAAGAGMVVGAVVLLIALLIGIDAVKRFGGVTGSIAVIGAWLAGGAALYVLAFR